MLMGQYRHTIDPKNRIIVPVKFREELGDKFVISMGLDGCLYLCKNEEWEEFLKGMVDKLPMNKDAREVQRFFMMNCQEVEPDKQGRIIVPTSFKEKAGLDKDVVMIGSFNKVEIWSKERLDAQTSDKNIEDIVETLANEYGLKF